MAQGVRNIVINFLGNATGLTNASNTGTAAVGRFSARTQKFAAAGLASVAAFGAGLATSLKAGVEGLLEGEEAEARLQDALSRAPKILAAQTAAIMANAEAIQAKTRFSYEDALAASTVLAAQDGANKAIRAGVADAAALQTAALDLATVLKVDAAAGAKFLGRALMAPEKASALLRKAGISLTVAEQAKIKAWTDSGRVGEAQSLILDKVKAKTEGAATAAGETLAGKAARAQAAFGEMQESLAQGLIPALQRLSDWGLRISGWLQDNPAKVKVAVVVLGSLAAVIGTVSLAIKLWTFVTKIQTAAWLVLNALAFANPFTILAIAVVALIAVVVLIAKKTHIFSNVFRAMGSAVGAVASTIGGWFSKIWGWIEKIGSVAVTVFGGLAEVITAPYRLAFNAIAGLWNNSIGKLSFEVPSWVPGLGGKGFSFPKLPMLAHGGQANAGRAHIVGERGPELFVPGRSGRVVSNEEMMGGGPSVINLNLDLGRGIHQVVQVNLADHDRDLRRTYRAGGRRTVSSATHMAGAVLSS